MAGASGVSPVSGDLARWVDPLIGTGGLVPAPAGSSTTYEALGDSPAKYPFGGLTYPGAVVPFGMVALSPDVQRDGLSWVAGYNYYDDTILGFSHMKTSGNGHAFGHVLLVPSAGPLELAPGETPEQGYRLRFSHEDERSEAGYYSVELEDEAGRRVLAELTASPRVGMHRYTFPGNGSGRVLIDLIHGVGPWNVPVSAHIEQLDERTLAGYRHAEPDKGPVYFAAEFSRPFAAFGIASGGELIAGATSATATELQAFVELDAQTDPVVVAKVALSWVSTAGALASLRSELPEPDFDAARTKARAAWEAALSKIRVEGGTESELRTFYTALYHAQLAPFELSDPDGRYLGADGALHTAPHPTYTFFSLWDAFRAVHPLLTVIQPERVEPIIHSLLDFGEQNDGLLPTWGLVGRDWGNMVGLHAMPVIAEAYAKGFTGFDAERALLMMRENMERDLVGLASYRALGYVAADEELRSAAATLELAYDDYAVASLARALGRDDSEHRTRAGSYRNVIDTNVGFARGRFSNGSWRSPFDPRAVSHYGPDDDFVEANSWQYTWSVLHDVKGLMELLGGRDAFVAKLDQLFEQPSTLLGRYSADVTGLWGQYAQGNEQSHHVAYLYAWAGASWKTQYRVRELMRRFYSDEPDGLPGNDDAGQMSAWFVWSALGLYPVDPVAGQYVLGSPLFTRATIDVGRGKQFVIEAHDNGADRPYIQAAKLNGAAFEQSYLTHAQLIAGGKLELVMGSEPNPSWASAPGAAPSSLSDEP